MNKINKFTFQEVEPSYPGLAELLEFSVGNPSKEKMRKVLNGYNAVNYHLIGCYASEMIPCYNVDDRSLIGSFESKTLLGIIGIEVIDKVAYIKHIAVLPENRNQGIAHLLIAQVQDLFSIKCFFAETDNDSVGFYRKCSFQCAQIDAINGIRYRCELNLM